MFFWEKKDHLHWTLDRNIYFRTFLFRSIPHGFYVKNKGLMKWPNRTVVTRTASMWNQSDRKTNTILSTYWNYFGHFTSPILFGSKIPPSFMYKHIYYVLVSCGQRCQHVYIYLLSLDTPTMKNQLLFSGFDI